MKTYWKLDEKWGEYRCSACGVRTYIRTKNCRNCGRKMENGEEVKTREKNNLSIED